MPITGMILGVGIWFVGALLFWVVFYRVLSFGLIKHLNERKQEQG